MLNIHPDMITVRTGFDTERNVHTGFSGTYASQFAVSGLSAVHGAAQKLKSEMKRLAAFVLETKEDDLEFGTGAQGPEIRSKSSGKSINYWGLANMVNVNSASLSPELYEVTLNCRYIWRAPFKVPDTKKKYGSLTLTYASQLHVAVVEVERDTFIPRILDYVAVDDCGTVINPPIVEGQVYGATAHGIGAALMENCVYDAVGNMLTSTFSDYIPITAMNMPKVKYGHIETPSPHSYSGAKGMGEGGAAPIHTISAALQDALFASDIMIEDSFNNADSLFRALKSREVGDAGKSGEKNMTVWRGRPRPRGWGCGRPQVARHEARVTYETCMCDRLRGHRKSLRGAPGAGCRGLGFCPSRRACASPEPRRIAGFGRAQFSGFAQGHDTSG